MTLSDSTLTLVALVAIGLSVLAIAFSIVGSGSRRSKEPAGPIQMSEALLAEGVFVTGFGYPVVPQGQARLRCQISAAHTREHLDRAIAAIAEVAQKFEKK